MSAATSQAIRRAAEARTTAARTATFVSGWWVEAGRPGERADASAAGLDTSRARGPQRPLLVFKLLALASLLEASPPGERTRGVTVFRELEGRGAFERLLAEGASLEAVLEPTGLLEPTRALAPWAGKLVSLLRFRRALAREGTLARVEAAGSGRDLARALRRDVTGDALGTGVLFVVREMARAGHWRAAGIDALACVPWSEVRASARRLGLLEREPATFEDLLAASEALGRLFPDAEAGELPLRAYGSSPVATPDADGLAPSESFT